VTARDLERLGDHVAGRLDAQLKESAPDLALRAALAQRARARTPSRSKVRLAGAFALAASLVVALGIFLSRRTTPVTALSFQVAGRPGTVGQWIAPDARAGVSLRFSEESRVALDPGSRAQVTRLDARGADVVLSSGLLHADVVPRPGNLWRIRTGPFLVEVKGTRFDVSWDERADVFELVLFEGHVVVSGCSLGQSRNVAAGERVRASCRPTGEAAPQKAPEAAPRETTGDRPTTTREVATPSAAPLVAPGDFAELARSGHYQRAYDLAASQGLEALRTQRGAEDVLLLGEAARLSGHADEARRSYQAVRRRFGSTPASARAAFELGRLEAAAGQAAASAVWFQTYLDELPGGPLAAAALGRLLEARVELGDRTRAGAAARTYLERYPTGAHAEAARKVLGSDTR